MKSVYVELSPAVGVFFGDAVLQGLRSHSSQCQVEVPQNWTSQKHLRTKVTPDFHLTYSKNGGNLGSESK